MSKLRKDLASEIDRVVADHEPVMILRGRGKSAAILLSLEDFEAVEKVSLLAG